MYTRLFAAAAVILWFLYLHQAKADEVDEVVDYLVAAQEAQQRQSTAKPGSALPDTAAAVRIPADPRVAEVVLLSHHGKPLRGSKVRRPRNRTSQTADKEKSDSGR